jgi:hypothetical protein
VLVVVVWDIMLLPVPAVPAVLEVIFQPQAAADQTPMPVTAAAQVDWDQVAELIYMVVAE